MIVNFKKNNKNGQILSDIDTLNLIREHFSVPNKAFGRRNNRFSQRRLYSITQSGKFEIGMLKNIVQFLDLNQIKYSIDNELLQSINPVIDNIQIKTFKNLIYREHQQKSIELALKNGRGLVIIPTAGGKTLIMAGIIESIRKSLNKPDGLAMVLVPSIQLVEQTSKDFEEYGIEKVTKWSGNNKLDESATTIVAGTQILLSEKTDLSSLKNIDFLLFDECIRKNTLVPTNKGNKKIQNIKKGDLVKSFNIKTKEIEFKPVLNTWKNLSKSNSYEEFLEIELDNGNIVHLTPNHKVYTDNGYKRADELSKNDNILSIDSSKCMNLHCKYLYAKTNTQTQMLNMWKRIKICVKTFKKFTSKYINQTILRQFFKKRLGGGL